MGDNNKVSLIDVRYEIRHGMPLYVVWVHTSDERGRDVATSHTFPSKFGASEFVRKKYPSMYQLIRDQMQPMPGTT